MGLFAHVLGIRPWEWELLDAREATSLIRFVEAFNSPPKEG